MSSVLINIVITAIVGVVVELFKSKIKTFGEVIRRKPYETTVIIGLLIIIGLLVPIR